MRATNCLCNIMKKNYKFGWLKRYNLLAATRFSRVFSLNECYIPFIWAQIINEIINLSFYKTVFDNIFQMISHWDAICVMIELMGKTHNCTLCWSLTLWVSNYLMTELKLQEYFDLMSLLLILCCTFLIVMILFSCVAFV